MSGGARLLDGDHLVRFWSNAPSLTSSARGEAVAHHARLESDVPASPATRHRGDGGSTALAPGRDSRALSSTTPTLARVGESADDRPKTPRRGATVASCAARRGDVGAGKLSIAITGVGGAGDGEAIFVDGAWISFGSGRIRDCKTALKVRFFHGHYHGFRPSCAGITQIKEPGSAIQ